MKEPYLRLIDIVKTFGNLVAVNGVSLDVEEGEFVCILGPSGCGKTTLLRIIAGLEEQDSGQIIQGGRDVSRLPPRYRDFGIVFQSYALFPNMTAAQNIAYGLETRKWPRERIEARVKELLELVGLPDVGHKYPAQLSGGQQQRIALARALAPSPGLLLLDEPLSALDARVRVSLRREIKHLQRRIGVTTIFVTHDQEEALVMADRIVVMNQGRIQQVGTPEEIYRHPANPFVADFVGVMNFLRGVSKGRDLVECAGTTFRTAEPHDIPYGEPIIAAIRPEDLRVHQGPNPAMYENQIQARVTDVEFLGSYYRLTTSINASENTSLVVEISTNLWRDLGIREGSLLEMWVPPDFVRVYPA